MKKRKMIKFSMLLLISLFTSSITFCQTGISTRKYKTTYTLILIKAAKEILSESEKFSNRHPDIKTTIQFKQPYFVLSISDCTSKRKIKKLKKSLKSDYPDAVIEKCHEEKNTK
ncbi:MAG: hypothetical protein V2A54_11120 [Bacteroidota bacterium]